MFNGYIDDGGPSQLVVALTPGEPPHLHPDSTFTVVDSSMTTEELCQHFGAEETPDPRIVTLTLQGLQSTGNRDIKLEVRLTKLVTSGAAAPHFEGKIAATHAPIEYTPSGDRQGSIYAVVGS